MKLKVLVFFTCLGIASTSLADQAAYIEKNDAVAAKALLQESTTIKSFCAPCGDKNSVSIPVKSLDVAYTNHQNYWELRINDQGVDLAYTYYLVNHKWRNVAMSIGLTVSEVPEFIE